ncbi:MAG TPA: trypsin-like peptidase domain-containing protein, partial [Thermodesulfobacteriota bacterium]|nr:trypsin-like peptidase domain-containing protein [Thermodesulfobacteriota bacterium]
MKFPNPFSSRKTAVVAALVLGLIFLVAVLGMASPSRRPAQVAEIKETTSGPVASPPAGAPTSFSDLAKKLSPTVVNVKVTKVEKTGDMQMPSLPEDSPFGDFFKQFPNMVPKPEKRQVQGTGSGVIISPDGYILTNNHVVDGAKEVTVTVADKEEYTAQVVGRDPKTDLALLKIKPKEKLQV